MARDASTTRRRRRRILSRLNIFRLFYSGSYSVLYLILLVLLAITPISMIYTAFEAPAFQYLFMIGGTYILTLVIAVFIYSSRIYTNRSVLASVGKAYIPIEEGEVSKRVRKTIVKQLERSAVIAWESRPRDVRGEILAAEEKGVMFPDGPVLNHQEHAVGLYLVVTPSRPPWGKIQHPGWSSPNAGEDNATPNVQFSKVIAELPHLIEAQAVSLAPADPSWPEEVFNDDEPVPADPAVVNILRRPPNAALREYLTQISYLGLIQPPEIGHQFLAKYERARFSNKPTSSADFDTLMRVFADLLAGMTSLSPAIISEIRRQTLADTDTLSSDTYSIATTHTDEGENAVSSTPSARLRSPVSSMVTPVTATSRPYIYDTSDSQETLGSVIQRPLSGRLRQSLIEVQDGTTYARSQASSLSLPSDVGSVLRHAPDDTGD